MIKIKNNFEYILRYSVISHILIFIKLYIIFVFKCGHVCSMYYVDEVLSHFALLTKIS